MYEISMVKKELTAFENGRYFTQIFRYDKSMNFAFVIVSKII